MKVYSVKIALRGVSPMVWRRLQVPGDTSLARLHHVIQIAYHWDDEYLHQFHIYGKDYGISYPGRISFSDDAHSVYLDDFAFEVGDKFTYHYNFFEYWQVDIRIEAINVCVTPRSINCVKGNGMPGVNKTDEIEPMLALLKAMATADETTIAGDILPLIDALDTVKFSRHAINRHLQAGMLPS